MNIKKSNLSEGNTRIADIHSYQLASGFKDFSTQKCSSERVK